ncbi:tetratricopeptide repeat protein [Burkholderia perseverans]|uniref:tetratricopeptide repeat protein n=1 Tax=Burkholderia perseverans TaxID=2615214 RepID=UPI001FEF7A29|nr:tetratricopeptide repeat-containing glycosyltransferase family protein [Burkholderia perseverans]
MSAPPTAPRSAHAHFELALSLVQENLYAEAEVEYRQVLQLMPSAAAAHSNLGNVLEVLDRLAEAETHVRIAAMLDPKLPEAHYNLGSITRQSGRFDEAEEAYRRALALRPDYPDAAFGLATLLLARGRFEEGWQRYESRYTHPRFVHADTLRRLACPQWRGEPLTGRAVLVWQEDGLGDMIQFARYLPMLKEAGAQQVTVACMRGLHRLLAGVHGVDAVLDHDAVQARDAHFDCWTSLMSAPAGFGTTLDTLPAPLAPPLDAALLAQWRVPLDMLAGRLKVGVVWRGNPRHHNDANRSLPSLATLAPLWAAPDIAFVSLQKGAGEAQAAQPPAGQPLLDLGSLVGDLADSAAIVAQLDLVIGVDTAMIHLAASLGVPCWVLLPSRDLDWRWMQGREDSPWYPGRMRLFRQWGDEGWTPVVARLGRALVEWAGEAVPRG